MSAFTSQKVSDVFCCVKSGYNDVRKSTIGIFSCLLRESIYSWPISKRHGDMLGCLQTGDCISQPIRTQTPLIVGKATSLSCAIFLFFPPKFHAFQRNMKNEMMVLLESGWCCSFQFSFSVQICIIYKVIHIPVVLLHAESCSTILFRLFQMYVLSLSV